MAVTVTGKAVNGRKVHDRNTWSRWQSCSGSWSPTLPPTVGVPIVLVSENMLRWLEANGARNEHGATRVQVQEHREGTDDGRPGPRAASDSSASCSTQATPTPRAPPNAPPGRRALRPLRTLPPAGTSEAGAPRRGRARVGSSQFRARRHHRAMSRQRRWTYLYKEYNRSSVNQTREVRAAAPRNRGARNTRGSGWVGPGTTRAGGIASFLVQVQ
ncbi:hypothetical protein B0H14DRAFT_2640844 [Mycena olivaceomarginata]|nr:hypothetical protein B0H14DRAFT_2640844 [Mycena olivaceomarginata]